MPWPVENQMVELAGAIVIKRERSVAGILQVEAPDAVLASKDLIELAARVPQYVADPMPWPVENQMVELAGAIVIKRERSVAGILQVEAPDAILASKD